MKEKDCSLCLYRDVPIFLKGNFPRFAKCCPAHTTSTLISEGWPAGEIDTCTRMGKDEDRLKKCELKTCPFKKFFKEAIK